jgi:hypothetical protein
LLRDVLWGQYCLFQVFRLQDDVFDRHRDDPVLVYAADQFFVEACRTFAKHFPRSSTFWAAFHDAVETTAKAVPRVDEIQITTRGPAADLLKSYTQVDSIFKVGAFALCLKYRRHAALGVLREATDHMTIAGQILDDLEDTAEDARRSRFNYVAKLLLSQAELRASAASPQRLLEHLTDKLLLGDGASAVLARVDAHLRRALSLIGPLKLPLLEEYLSAGRTAVHETRLEFHRKQVEAVLGPMLAASGADGHARSGTS